jgi:hypothetical protein
MSASNGSKSLMEKFALRRATNSPTANDNRSIADHLTVSLDYFPKNVHDLRKAHDRTLPMLSEVKAAHIDDSFFVADNADAGVVVEPAQADEPIGTTDEPPKTIGKCAQPTDDDA